MRRLNESKLQLCGHSGSRGDRFSPKIGRQNHKTSPATPELNSNPKIMGPFWSRNTDYIITDRCMSPDSNALTTGIMGVSPVGLDCHWQMHDHEDQSCFRNAPLVRAAWLAPLYEHVVTARQRSMHEYTCECCCARAQVSQPRSPRS